MYDYKNEHFKEHGRGGDIKRDATRDSMKREDSRDSVFTWDNRGGSYRIDNNSNGNNKTWEYNNHSNSLNTQAMDQSYRSPDYPRTPKINRSGGELPQTVSQPTSPEHQRVLSDQQQQQRSGTDLQRSSAEYQRSPDYNHNNTTLRSAYELINRSYRDRDRDTSTMTYLTDPPKDSSLNRTSNTLSSSTGRTLPNGTLAGRSLSTTQKKGLSASRPSLSLSNSRVTLYGKDCGVEKSLLSLGLMCVLSLVFVILGLQLLFKFMEKQDFSGTTAEDILLPISMYNNAVEVGVALCSLVIMLDLSCVMVCSMQCFFAAKILKVPQGENRAFKYLKECAGTRFISITGFYISIPAFMGALLTYFLIRFRSTPAVIALAIVGFGIVFVLIGVGQSTHYWRIEKRRADENLPVYDGKNGKGGSRGLNGDSGTSELSTLV